MGRTGSTDGVVCQLSVRYVVIFRVEVWHAPTRAASVIPEVMRQLKDPTPPRASRVLQERAG